MVQTVFDGITSHRIRTPRLTAGVLERPGDDGGPVAVFVHGNVSSSLFWQPTMLALPARVRALAIDLRGFGDSDTLPVDATRGVRDFSDDVASVLDELGTGPAHIVGWSMGGGVVMQLLIDRPELVASLTLISPVSPYGFGGTDAEGRVLDAGEPGVGGGGANPDFVQRLQDGDRGDESPASPRNVLRTAYVADPASAAEFEDVWVESMLSTRTGVDNYPGDGSTTSAWPGFGPGTRGVLNTMAPRYFDTTGIVDVAAKPPVLWVHGLQDAIVSDASFFDLNQLGALGVVPGWPGADLAPAQPMVTQTRTVLDRYAAAGGEVRELALDGCGHSAHLEAPGPFRDALEALIA
ncbi:alpha/beta hydrolase [Protaetiibacter mangrovi]|uniref:Alpha/beta hydrolase n=1 Tax=Protaetiibacter mangrovi TaxID=2970926 RepID=A0ABT1ZJ69_9MICO|nr:alpha/beta hydrolase [Protaetiibacter mangrovi]MCS0500731.1 alpha/beta hydrolase [Protaetiibacter mangrovi]TPX04176.1 alpha/beta hydrolase [Schumannella luteola]